MPAPKQAKLQNKQHTHSKQQTTNTHKANKSQSQQAIRQSLDLPSPSFNIFNCRLSRAAVALPSPLRCRTPKGLTPQRIARDVDEFGSHSEAGDFWGVGPFRVFWGFIHDQVDLGIIHPFKLVKLSRVGLACRLRGN